ncbi:unnamed protein product [Durusdinium trenchii]
MLFAGQIKVLLTFLVFGFEMKVCEVGPSASSSCSGLQEFDLGKITSFQPQDATGSVVQPNPRASGSVRPADLGLHHYMALMEAYNCLRMPVLFMFVVAAYPSILLFLMDGMIKDHKDLEEVCNLIIPSSDILWKFLYVYFLIILAQYSAHLPPVLFCWCVKGGSKCAGIALAKYGEIFRPDCKSFLTRESEEAGTASKSDMDARHLVACWGEWPCTPFSPPGNTGTDQHLKAVQAMERERERDREQARHSCCKCSSSTRQARMLVGS